MKFKKIIIPLFIFITSTLSAAQGPYVANPAVTKVPQLNFQAGLELIYKGNGSRTTDRVIFGTDDETRIWVTDRNPDDSWRLVVRRTVASYKIDENGQRTDNAPETVWARWDLAVDGSFRYNRTNEDLDPAGIFIPLPSNILDAGLGWTVTKKNFWEQDAYTLDGRSSDSLWIVNDRFTNPLVAIGRMTQSAVFYIDPRRGLPIKKEGKFVQMVGETPHETITATFLESAATADSTWLGNLKRDAELYFQADSQYDELMDQGERDYKRTDDCLKRAEKILRDVRDKTTIPELQAQLNQEIAGVPDDVNYIREEAKKRAKIVDTPARDWRAVDFQGQSHTLKDFRKKVVIMDFWYRGCPWCIMAFPQVKKLAEYFKDQPVAILGMNVDKADSNAQFVIEKMGLNYLNLKAGAIAKDYGINSYPHLLIIDQKGLIRDEHIGYTPDLFEQVTRSVATLLGKK
jgi:thiol-disulfide isomerase/thioredoxin